jgi:hypothetical protein
VANAVVVSTANSVMDDVPLWEQAAGGDAAINYTGTNDRTLFDALVQAEGVVGIPGSLTGPFAVTQRGAGANYTVDVAAGAAVITGDSVAGQGKYLIRSQGSVNIPYAGGAPASGTRIHRIIARIRDKPSDGGTTYDWTLEWLEDTGSGTPAQPNSAITLALVTIATGQASVLNANIADQRLTARPHNSLGVLGGNRWSGGGNLVTGLTGTELVIMTTPTLFLPANTQIEVSAGVRLLDTVSAGSTYLFKIRDGNTTGGTERGEFTWTSQSLSFGYNQYFRCSYDTGSTPVIQQFCLTAIRVGGGGQLTMIAGGVQHNTHLWAQALAPAGTMTTQATP